MSTIHKNCSWPEDLLASRDLNEREKAGFELILGWMDRWRIEHGLNPCRETLKTFWRMEVLKRERLAWQFQQWTEDMRWYL